jgi:CHRD domain-containing protein
MDAGKLLLAAATLAFFPSFNSMQASAQTISLNAVLLGGNQCDGVAPPAGPKCRKGDTDGFGLAGITFPASGMLCVTLQVDNLAGATLAHIHLGKATFNGDIQVTLPTPAGGNPGVSAGCIVVDAALIAAIRANPGNYYINVHNGTFPDGAVRGQLF